MRRQDRENAIMVLYMMSINEITYEEAINLYEEYTLKGNKLSEYAVSIVTGVCNEVDALEAFVTLNLENWSFKRLNLVDRAIVLVATYEMKSPKIDKRIAINEAIEITRKYSDVGDGKAVKFINSVLDKVAKKLETL